MRVSSTSLLFALSGLVAVACSNFGGDGASADETDAGVDGTANDGGRAGDGGSEFGDAGVDSGSDAGKGAPIIISVAGTVGAVATVRERIFYSNLDTSQILELTGPASSMSTALPNGDGHKALALVADDRALYFADDAVPRGIYRLEIDTTMNAVAIQPLLDTEAVETIAALTTLGRVTSVAYGVSTTTPRVEVISFNVTGVAAAPLKADVTGAPSDIVAGGEGYTYASASGVYDINVGTSSLTVTTLAESLTGASVRGLTRIGTKSYWAIGGNISSLDGTMTPLPPANSYWSGGTDTVRAMDSAGLDIFWLTQSGKLYQGSSLASGKVTSLPSVTPSATSIHRPIALTPAYVVIAGDRQITLVPRK